MGLHCLLQGEIYFLNFTSYAYIPWLLSKPLPFIVRKHANFHLTSEFDMPEFSWDSLCAVVVRVPGCTHKGPGFEFRNYQIFLVGMCLERGSLGLVRINEELLERKIRCFGL
jgi:hypothetical protein